MIAEELNIDQDPLGKQLLQMAAEFFRLQQANPKAAARVANAAAVVVAVWPVKPRVIGALPARGGELLESGEDRPDVIAMFCEDEETARWLAGAPAH